jgi:hypothetical protein
MRKILLPVIGILFAFTSNAQISKGSIFLGGGFTVSSQENENTGNLPNSWSTHNFIIDPSIGWALKKNLILGAGPSYGSFTAEDNSNASQKRHAWGINVFIRKYMELGKNFYLFGEGNLNGFKADGEDKSNQVLVNKVSGYGITLGFSPGVSYAVNKRFQVEAGIGNLFYIGYNSSKTEYFNSPNKTKSKSFGAGANISGFSPFSLGFRFLVAK